MKTDDIRRGLREAGESARRDDLEPAKVAGVQEDAAGLIALHASARVETAWPWRPALGFAAAALACVALCVWLLTTGEQPTGPVVAERGALRESDALSVDTRIDVQIAKTEQAARAALRAAERKYVAGVGVARHTITGGLHDRVAAVSAHLRAE